ncbi:hypothetical protein LG298_07505 [Cytobacillus firmus]|uniref:hypothetical protein n=1 Tax=Cytobacillus firmus TaxID=1399 RepID=UPI0038513408
MMFIKIDARFIDSRSKPHRTVYSVAIPAKTIEEAERAVIEGVAFSMKKNGNKLLKLNAIETDINTYLKLAQ